MRLDAVLTIVFAAAAAAYLLLAAELWRSRQSGGRRVAAVFVLVGLWCGGGALAYAGSAGLGLAARVAHFAGAALLPVLVLLVFHAYVGRPLGRLAAGLLSLVPLATLLFAASNPLHGLVWHGPGPLAWGPWFLYVHAPYSYALLAWTIGMLLLHSSAVTPANRAVVLLLAATVCLPTVALVLHDLGLVTHAAAAVPATFTALLPVFAWLVLREQVVEHTPLAYATVFQNMTDPVVVVDARRRVIGLNSGAERMLRLRESEALRVSLDALFGPDVPEVNCALDSGAPQRMLTQSGRFLHVQASPMRAGSGDAGQVLLFRDVSDVERAQQEVRSSEKLLRTLIDHSVNGVVRLRWASEEGSRSLRCVFANAAAGRFLSAAPESMLERDAGAIIRLACSGMDADEARTVVDKFLCDTRHGEVVDVETRVDDGAGGKWLRVIGEPVGDNVAVTFVDVTDRKAKELQMESIAWSDPLTGVLNRRGFERDAARRLSESDDLATGALLFIDLNDFKTINDRFGHEVGDRLLTIAADRLRRTLRACDIIGRPGGDEFVALVPDVEPELAESLATRVATVLEQPYRIGEAQLACTASIGLALYPEHANTLTGLMRAADQAMYRAKARSRNVVGLGCRHLLEKAG